MLFGSKAARACTRFVPMDPAPPVTRTVLRWKVSEKSCMLLPRSVLALHPLHGPSNAFLRGNPWVVLQLPDRLGAVHRLGHGGEGLRLLEGDEGIVAASALRVELREAFHVTLA